MSKHNTIGKGKRERSVNGGDDQYYTNHTVALGLTENILQIVDLMEWDNFIMVEPAAGTGSFILPLIALNIDFLAYDINPKHELIENKDFLNIDLSKIIAKDKKIIVYGNPPFGYCARLATRFFNHAAKYGDMIAFVVPKTFRKMSIHDKLDPRFHLFHDVDIESDAFFVDDVIYDVPCVFQIWIKRDHERKVKKYTVDNPWFEYTTKDKADFAIRRAGWKAGEVLEGLNHTKSSTHFCKTIYPGISDIIKQLDFSYIKIQTVGVRSIGKKEIHKALAEYFDN